MIKGFDGGADDYIKKPFSIMELITRVKALLRRTAKEEPKLLKLDDLVIDHERHVVTVNNEPVDLTYKVRAFKASDGQSGNSHDQGGHHEKRLGY